MNRIVGTSGTMRTLASVAVCLALTSLLGCGGSGSDKATVTGKVTYNNTPVGGGTLTLYDEKGSTYPISLSSDGTFNVSGVPIGHMGVAIVPGGPAAPAAAGSGAGAAAPAAPVDVPAQYRNPKTSGLTWDIKEGKNPSKEFDLK